MNPQQKLPKKQNLSNKKRNQNWHRIKRTKMKKTNTVAKNAKKWDTSTKANNMNIKTIRKALGFIAYLAFYISSFNHNHNHITSHYNHAKSTYAVYRKAKRTFLKKRKKRADDGNHCIHTHTFIRHIIMYYLFEK